MYKIAIIDDENNILDMLESFLSMSFEVTTFDSSLSAFNNVMNNNYDIILCDIMMPEMSGLEFLKKLRDNNNNVKVLMMTAYDSMDKALEAHKYGAKNYLKKPFKSLKDVQDKISLELSNQ